MDSDYALGHITPSGYVEPENYSYIDLKEHRLVMAEGLKHLGSMPMWAQADLCRHVQDEADGGGIPDEWMLEFRKASGLSAGTIRNRATLSRAWPIEWRIVGSHVSPSHHSCLNSCEPEKKRGLIEEADAKGWSVAQLEYQRDNYGKENAPEEETEEETEEPEEPEEEQSGGGNFLNDREWMEKPNYPTSVNLSMSGDAAQDKALLEEKFGKTYLLKLREIIDSTTLSPIFKIETVE